MRENVTAAVASVFAVVSSIVAAPRVAGVDHDVSASMFIQKRNGLIVDAAERQERPGIDGPPGFGEPDAPRGKPEAPR